MWNFGGAYMWVTIRGFAMVPSWLEQYKLAQKENTKKSKSLRKTLKQASNPDT